MKTILVTGADGYIGMEVCNLLLASNTWNVLMWVRSKNESEFLLKKQKIENYLGAEKYSKATVIYGDLSEAQAFAKIDPNSIHQILHTAAIIRFNVEEDLADTVNLGGSERLFQWALKCKNLEKFDYVSTVYASGLNEGHILEEPLPHIESFANHYERSKNAAENSLILKYAALPWRISRVATIICEDEVSGTVSQFNAIHNTLRLLYNGLISLVPGKEETPLYFVTRKFVCKSLAQIIENPDTHKIYHICHSREETATLGTLLDLVFKHFENDEDYVKKRIRRPLLVSEENFQALASNLQGMSHSVVGQALGSISPFASQLFKEKIFANTQLRAVLPDYQAPDTKLLIENTINYLVASKWGRF